MQDLKKNIKFYFPASVIAEIKRSNNAFAYNPCV